MAQEIEFEWDDPNIKHLAVHTITPLEFEFVLLNNAVDLDYEWIENEVRYRSVGLTSSGRLLPFVWTVRNGKILAVTGFPAGYSDKKAFWEISH